MREGKGRRGKRREGKGREGKREGEGKKEVKRGVNYNTTIVQAPGSSLSIESVFHLHHVDAV